MNERSTIPPGHLQKVSSSFIFWFSIFWYFDLGIFVEGKFQFLFGPYCVVHTVHKSKCCRAAGLCNGGKKRDKPRPYNTQVRLTSRVERAFLWTRRRRSCTPQIGRSCCWPLLLPYCCFLRDVYHTEREEADGHVWECVCVCVLYIGKAREYYYSNNSLLLAFSFRNNDDDDIRIWIRIRRLQPSVRPSVGPSQRRFRGGRKTKKEPKRTSRHIIHSLSSSFIPSLAHVCIYMLNKSYMYKNVIFLFGSVWFIPSKLCSLHTAVTALYWKIDLRRPAPNFPSNFFSLLSIQR